jgi:hypothetical protein
MDVSSFTLWLFYTQESPCCQLNVMIRDFKNLIWTEEVETNTMTLLGIEARLSPRNQSLYSLSNRDAYHEEKLI